MKKTLLLILIALCGGAASASPQSALYDSLAISLLTCEPGPAVYEHYGHTALRVRNGQGMDIVFNYGCFDFNTPFFGLRFALGQTDYLLGAYDYSLFEKEYFAQNRSVWEQKLNLSPTEARDMAQALFVNAQPEHRVYRYNFLYNNCTTRCRDLIEQYTHGTVVWPADSSEMTLRGIMHKFNQSHQWASLGIDLLLGCSIDKNSTVRERMFSPVYLMQYLENATIDGKNIATPAVKIITSQHVPSETDNPISITYIFLFVYVLFLVVALLLFMLHRNIALRRICQVLIFSTGLVGLIPTFLFFFSAHPSVDTNILVLCLNPLPFILLFARKTRIRQVAAVVALSLSAVCLCVGTIYNPFDGFNSIVLTQYIPPAIYIILLIYTTALVIYYLLEKMPLNVNNK